MGVCAFVSVAGANVVVVLLSVGFRLELGVLVVASVCCLSCVLWFGMKGTVLVVVCCMGSDCSL